MTIDGCATTSVDVGRRRRGKRKKSWEQRRDEAQLELERAESALAYRRAQLTEAETELASLEGPSGWLAALLGRREAYREEIQGRMKALQTEVLAGRKRLIEARRVIGSFERQAQERAQKDRQRDDELEQFAARVRDSGMHPLKEPLAEIEQDIDANAQQLALLDEAIAAAGSLSATMKAVLAAGRKAHRWAGIDAFQFDLPAAAHGWAHHNIQHATADVPAAVDRFNAACEKLELRPLNVEVPDIGMPWEQLLSSGILADLHYEERLVRFKRRVEDETQMVTDTLLHLVTRRKTAFEAQEASLARRRQLLDEALG